MFNDQTQTDNWDGFFRITHYSVLSALICLARLGPPLGESPGAHAENSVAMGRFLPPLEEGASSRQKARREWGRMGAPGKGQAEGSDRTGCASSSATSWPRALAKLLKPPKPVRLT